MLKLDWNVLYTIINLVVLYLLMKKFLFGPISNIMEQRRALIENELADARTHKAEANELKQKYEGSLKSAREEAGQIVERAKAEAKIQQERMIEAANEKAGEIMQKAQETIEVQREQAMQEMQSQVASLAMAAAAKIMSEKSSSDKDLDLYDQFIEKAGDSHDADGH